MENKVLSFKGAKGIKVNTDDLAPFVLKDQVILYSEFDDVRDGDYVFCRFKDKPGATVKQYKLDPDSKKNCLAPVSLIDKETISFDRKNLKFMYRVVGIITRYW